MARESGEPILDVRGVADLARLAVAAVEGRAVVGLAAVFLVQQLDDLAAARKAADVGRQNSLGARSHSLRASDGPGARRRGRHCVLLPMKNLERLNVSTRIDGAANGMV